VEIVRKIGMIAFFVGLGFVALVVILPHWKPFMNFSLLGKAVYGCFIITIACFGLDLIMKGVNHFRKPPSEI